MSRTTPQSNQITKRIGVPAAGAEFAGDILEQTNLTQNQLLIWLGQKLNPKTPLYNMAVSVFIEGEIEPRRFRKSFQHLVDECDCLRTTFVEDDGIPRQCVHPDLAYEIELLDLSHLAQSRAVLDAQLIERSQLLFDLRERLFDTALIKLGTRQFVWYLNQHHLITDAWSTSVLYRRMESIYGGKLNGQPSASPLPPFHDYVEYEKKFRTTQPFQTSVDYWDKKLASLGTPIAFYGRTASTTTARSERILRRLGKDRTRLVRAMAAERDIRSLTPELSIFNIFATVLFAYLYRVRGNRQLQIGTPSHNRSSAKFKETIGPFIEVFPLVTVVDEQDTYRTLLDKVSQETRALLIHARPGTSAPSRNRTFDVLLNYFNASFFNFQGFATHTTWVHPGYADPAHALRLQIFDFDRKNDFVLGFDLNCEVFAEEQRPLPPEHFLNVLDGFLADRNQPIQQPEIISSREKRQFIRLNRTHVPHDEHETVVQLFEKQAEANANDIALVCSEDHLSYRVLNVAVNQLARYLTARGVGRGSHVGICMKRSPVAVVAMLGVLRAGGAYVPIDPSYPQDRIRFMVEDSGANCVLTESSIAGRLPKSADAICIDRNKVHDESPDSTRRATERLIESEISVIRLPTEDLDEDCADRCLPEAGPNDAAYVIYTSGSTGQPKGVVIQHGALANYVRWARRTYVGSRRLAFPLFSSLSFDLTVTSVFVPLISGGKIVIYPESDGKADLALFDVIQEDVVDAIKLTPSHLALLTDHELGNSRIGQLIVGGENLRRDLTQSIWDRFGGRVKIHNEYGPTEATVGCIVHTFNPTEDKGTSVPIGRPIDNMQAYVLNSQLKPVPQGVAGELYLAGKGLAQGYWDRHELTSERFVSNPFRPGTLMYRTGDLARAAPSGALEYLGRNDNQVKIRGARIEPCEIEGAILQHPQVRSCVVDVVQRAVPSSDGELRHCARCGLPSNYPGSTFDTEGVCNLCQAFDRYQDRAKKYFKTMDDLRAIFAESMPAKQSQYDCLALLSGGKDSTYALCQLVDMGLTVLAFTLDNGYISDQAKANIRRVVETLRVDHVFGSTPAMNDIFVDSLQRHSNVCHGCFKTIYTLSMTLAREKRIPHIVTGLSRGQFFETRLTEELFTDPQMDLDHIDQTILEARKAYHRVDDAVSRLLDVEMFKDDQVFDEVQFIDFYRYCPVQLNEMLEYLDQRVPWIRPSDTGRSTNCLINDVGIFVHKRERGYHNYAFPYSWDVRMGHKTREAALTELDDDIDPQHVLGILSEIGYGSEWSLDGSHQRLVAYFVADEALSAADVKSHAASQLPDFMVPSYFVRLDEIPLTPNGKVDRDALPAPQTGTLPSAAGHVGPRSEAEKTLVRIWSDVLRVPRVGIRDNFFDLGGDSIAAIQIIAGANRAGLQLAPGQLFDTLTIEQLAALAGTSRSVQAEQGPITGVVPLTPVQRWFFEKKLPEPDQWNHVMVVAVPFRLNRELLAESLRHLAQHHDALRLRFTNDGELWQAFADVDVSATPLVIVEESDVDQRAWQRCAAEVEARLSASLDLAEGKLLAAATVGAPDGTDRLILIAHHLAVDTISWPILLEDLADVYRQLSSGRQPVLPPKTTSLKQWGEMLVLHARSESLYRELAFWRETLQRPIGELPTDRDEAGGNTEASADTICVQLGTDETQRLLQQAPRAYGTRVHELLLAALGVTLHKRTGKPNVRIDVEGHGRESLDAQIDVSRTVGWFTGIYPVTLSLPDDLSPAAILVSVKDQLRRIPRNGIGYGLLRYLCPDHHVRRELATAGPAQVLFNYLGRMDQLVPESSGFRCCEPLKLLRDPHGIRPHLLEINAAIIEDQLRVDWTFSTNCHRESTVAQLAAEFFYELRTLLDHCQITNTRRFTASDFPQANLDETKLKKLAAVLRKHNGDDVQDRLP